MIYRLQNLNISKNMKKLTAILALMALSSATVLHAGEGAACEKSKTACCDKTKTSAQAKSGCSDAGSCCESTKAAVTGVKVEKKGAALLVQLTADTRAKS
jgi:hypothetical protein